MGVMCTRGGAQATEHAAHLPLSLMFAQEGLRDASQVHSLCSQTLFSKQTSLRKHLILMCRFTMCESRQWGEGGGGERKNTVGLQQRNLPIKIKVVFQFKFLFVIVIFMCCFTEYV